MIEDSEIDPDGDKKLHLPFIQSRVMLQSIVREVEDTLGRKTLKKIAKPKRVLENHFESKKFLSGNKLLVAMGMTPRLPKNIMKKA